MLESLPLNRILFLDIETVPCQPSFSELDDDYKNLWDIKSKYFREQKGLNLEESYGRAGIYAEFGKIICICVGFFAQIDGEQQLRIKSFSHEHEGDLLLEFAELLNSHFKDSDQFLCAHNGKEFDFPFIARRMVIHGIKLPYQLDLAGKKPWEVTHIDTMTLWKFGDYKHFTSIKLLTKILGIPTPKDDIDGSDVARVYYKEKDLKRIVEYCQKDVIAVAQIILKYRIENLLEAHQIHYVA